MSVEVHCIRNFTIDNLYDYSGDWGVKFQGNFKEDWLSTDWTSETVNAVRKCLEDFQLKID